jgi:hypothetical protein
MNGVAVIHRAREGARSASTARLGTWWVNRDRTGAYPCVSIKCPSCECACSIQVDEHGHTIHADGTVTPSVVCPRKRADGTPCGWHEHIRLDDWKPLARQLDPRSAEYMDGR